VQWAVEEKADFIIGETFSDLGEAMLALQSIQQHGNGIQTRRIWISFKSSQFPFNG